ncbi:hypothetical protein B0O40_0355 [Ruminococcaceae bacterium R-25]|nr:hypothetical protein B0O40_0355 [Ruminococcaceae bacterium R-25]SUQ10992.1 hypothetical protein SAMN06297423_0355 [Oscillospiraceae bacterium]
MDIRNRMATIKKLRTNACQDFLSLVLVHNWKDVLETVIENETKKQFANTYIPTRRIMREKGKDEYSVYDMDITIINAIIVHHNKELLNSIQQDTINAFLKIKDDKNDMSHANDNEDDSELYSQSFIFLRNIKEFIRTVDEKEINSIDNTNRQAFLQKYSKEIKELEKTIDKERFETNLTYYKIKKDIKTILESDNQQMVWNLLFESYSKGLLLEGGEKEYYAFIVEAAKAGIIQAYEYAADYYIQIEKDYDMAEKYLYYLYENKVNERYNVQLMMTLADIYLHNLSKHKGDGHAVINSLIDDGYNIQKTPKGTQYILVSKVDGRTCHIIDIPQEKESPKETIGSKHTKISVGNVSGTKKMRLGRVHKKKTNNQE